MSSSRQAKDPVSWPPRRRNLNRGSCHTLIMDLKILARISFLFSDTFKFTVFSTVLQTHIVLLLSPIFLHTKSSKVFSRITSHLKISKRIAYFPAFYPKFLHKIIQKGYFGHFLQWSPFINLSAWIINQILLKSHFSIASESVWVVLVPKVILVFSHQIFFWQRGILKYLILVVCSF